MLAHLFKLSLLTLLPIAAFAAHLNPLLNRHHDLAKRVDSGVQLFGRATHARWSFYNAETGNAGSCGNFLTNGGFTVAVNAAQMNSGLCGKSITMTYNGRSTSAVIADTCPGCPPDGLDLTPGLFSFFADQGAGIIYGDWNFAGAVAAAPKPTPTWKPAPTSTWTPPKPTSTWTPPKPTSTRLPQTTSSSSSSSSPHPTSSSTKSSSIPAAPTGYSATGNNLAGLYQCMVQMAGLVAAGANN